MSTPTMARRAQEIALDRIEVGGNVRELDAEHVSALAGSMAVRGLIVPVAVRPLDGERFALVAGEHRLAAARELGWQSIAAVISEQAEGTSGDQGAENVLRKTLTAAGGGPRGREDARRRLQRRRRRDRAGLAQAPGDRAPADPRAARDRADARRQR